MTFFVKREWSGFPLGARCLSCEEGFDKDEKLFEIGIDNAGYKNIYGPYHAGCIDVDWAEVFVSGHNVGVTV